MNESVQVSLPEDCHSFGSVLKGTFPAVNDRVVRFIVEISYGDWCWLAVK